MSSDRGDHRLGAAPTSRRSGSRSSGSACRRTGHGGPGAHSRSDARDPAGRRRRRLRDGAARARTGSSTCVPTLDAARARHLSRHAAAVRGLRRGRRRCLGVIDARGAALPAERGLAGAADGLEPARATVRRIAAAARVSTPAPMRTSCTATRCRPGSYTRATPTTACRSRPWSSSATSTARSSIRSARRAMGAHILDNFLKISTRKEAADMELIPAIDLRDGRCVRLLKGDFAQETRYDVDPVELARAVPRRGRARGCTWSISTARSAASPSTSRLIERMRAASRSEGATRRRHPQSREPRRRARVARTAS